MEEGDLVREEIEKQPVLIAERKVTYKGFARNRELCVDRAVVQKM